LLTRDIVAIGWLFSGLTPASFPVVTLMRKTCSRVQPNPTYRYNRDNIDSLPAINAFVLLLIHLTSTMADRVKEVAAGEAERIMVLATDAVKSRAYLYPLKASLPGSTGEWECFIDPS
jgi:hypothetical protein